MTGIANGEITEFFREKANRKSLDKLIAAEMAEWKTRPKQESAGTKVSRTDAEGIFGDAKEKVDSFLGINADEYNPSLDTASFFRGSIRSLLLHSGVTLLGISGIMSSSYNEIGSVSGKIIAAGGSAMLLYTLGIAAFGSSVMQAGEYNPEKNQILALRSRKNIFSYTLMHEYGHAVTSDKFRKGNNYIGFREGFCIGMALHLQDNESKLVRANTLSLSIKRLAIAKKSLRNLDDIARNCEKEKYSSKTLNMLYMLGYAMFRLAEERHGAGVYREVYNGNSGILFR